MFLRCGASRCVGDRRTRKCVYIDVVEVEGSYGPDIGGFEEMKIAGVKQGSECELVQIKETLDNGFYSRFY
jgi:hypothetical protein